MKVILWSFVAVAVIAGNVMIKYHQLESKAEKSRFSNWDSDFKEGFIKECVGGVKEGFLVSERENEELIELYGQSYCGCMANKVESAHILRTEFNVLKTEEEFIAQSDKLINEFMSSEKGQNAVADCTEEGKVTANFDQLEKSLYRDVMISNCVQGTLDGVEQADVRYEVIKKFGSVYCDCLIGHMFDAKIIDAFEKKKRNGNYRQIASVDQQISVRIDDFMNSDNGQKRALFCDNKAKTSLK